MEQNAARHACQAGGTAVLPGGRGSIRSGVAESLDVDRVEDVTAAQLGASPWQLQASRSAVYSYMLRWWVTEPAAIDAVWASGNWRELTAEYADEQLDLADKLTGERG